ncbi:hypothetical protein E1B28_011829 [Marasmius oreades]|uniref:Protein kinase domain-containing protein n=1 Tax=Marasmius oreades TaxID=181124 RepID=A0A9P7USJ0_9AGAR|nr:uncharacterized protein E1B28_011829 [Marasmius oreades]KAG7090229.1 hypothetical protein E1B28_011829 [Marasmius oreades]
MMLRLSKRSGLCPRCLMIENVEKLGNFPVGGGTFGDVWRGKIGKRTFVCLKVVKIYHDSDVQKLLNEYMREAIVWQQLEHPNLLPFIGVYFMGKNLEQICLVSPWMERGNLACYLKDTSRDHVDHYSLVSVNCSNQLCRISHEISVFQVHDIASGLLYLHNKKIAHGDLKALNILITPDGRACIGDFGLSRVIDTYALSVPTSSMVTQSKGTTSYLSPELLWSDPPCTSSRSSDIYAFACVSYEVFTGTVPFHGFNDGQIIVAVVFEKKHPLRPDSDSTSLNDRMWNIMVDCWNTDPDLRPLTSEVFARVDDLKGPKADSNTKPGFNLTEIRKNVKYPLFDAAALTRLQTTIMPTPNLQSESTVGGEKDNVQGACTSSG